MVEKVSGIPEFAVLGHPNEGKSSVLSTLAEDDTVRISPMPGETRECNIFPVLIDGKEILRFTDTPGFQNPHKTLQWMQDYEGLDETLIGDFVDAHRNQADFRDDCELFQPLLRGAGIIFVVDGSRPLRNVDKVEMEILRLTGCPRMAIINCKEEESLWLDKWQSEFRKNFIAIRLFNSCQATYTERIALLESLKGIDQHIQPVLDTVVAAFRRDWQQRNQQISDLLIELLQKGLGYSYSIALKNGADENAEQKRLYGKYEQFLRNQEKECQKQMRSLYKHNIFNVDLPPQSLLQEDLFAEKTWQFLGLSTSQLVVAGALSGAAVGAGVDVAAAGLSFGIFSTLGGIAGAAGTAFKGKSVLSGTRLLGMRLDAQQLQVGPVKNIQLLYVLLDRQFLFYSHIINWSHGRRNYTATAPVTETLPAKAGYTTSWGRQDRMICSRFFTALQKEDNIPDEEVRSDFATLIQKTLEQIARD